MRIAGIVFVMIVLLASSTVASAQSIDATELFKQGREMMQRGDVAGACPKFAESARLDAKVGTLLNLGDCEEKLGRIASARQSVQRAIDLGRAQNDERVALAEQRFAMLDKRVPRLTIRLAAAAPNGATVARDGVQLGEASLGAALPVEPGKHQVMVSAPKHAERGFDVSLSESESYTLEVDVGDALPDATPLPVHQTLPAAHEHGASPLKTIGFVTGGAGLAALVAGAVTGLVAVTTNADSRSKCDPPAYTTCDPSGVGQRNQARTEGDVSTVLFVTGAVLLATGLVLVIVAPKPRSVAWLEPILRW